MASPPHIREEDVSTMSLDDRSRRPSPLVVASASSSSATPLRDDSPPPPSVSETPTAGTPVRKTANGKVSPQLIGHFPTAEEEARKTFHELADNVYQYGTLGRSREALESMTCDCQYVPNEDEPWVACGDGSDCINRLTQVECMEDDCRCRSHCQNQRMQRKQHAQIDVVLTEKKGYGLRAATNIVKDAFIYEYIGEVVSQHSLAKRMREYAEEGIKHFYFMMLQKDEFIDATKKGGIGRFANHSCNPNCYVAKWTVGKHVRMGIYAKRKILMHEELTFNYNVDRYGHDAQPCYCGEANCIGVLGGKTQTDVAAMDDLYLDALGISDEVEKYGLKGNKKKKSKQLDEDYVPVLSPLLEKDVPKVVQAIRQTQSKKMLLKLLTRIKITEDQSALRQFMRLRGYSLMCNILEDNSEDLEICQIVLECISNWPLLQRNKIEDSQIETPVKSLTTCGNEAIQSIAEKLLAHWATLEVGYRIPKRIKGEDDEPDAEPFQAYTEEDESRANKGNYKRSRVIEIVDVDISHISHIKPLGKATALHHQPVRYQSVRYSPPPGPPNDLMIFPFPRKKVGPSRQEIADVIADAAKRAEEEKKRVEQEAETVAAAKAAEEKKRSTRPSSSKDKGKKKALSTEELEKLKEKKLMKLVGAVVVKCMSKYRDRMEHDAFKKHAKELTQIISEKEKKSNSYQTGKLDALSEEKVIKIKKFAKEYIAKLLRRMEKSGQSKRSSHHSHSHSHSRHQTGSKSSMTSDPRRSGQSNGSTSGEKSTDVNPPDSTDPEHKDDHWWGTPSQDSPHGSGSRSMSSRTKQTEDQELADVLDFDDEDDDQDEDMDLDQDETRDDMDQHNGTPGHDSPSNPTPSFTADPSPATDNQDQTHSRSSTVQVVGMDIELDADDGLATSTLGTTSPMSVKVKVQLKRSKWDQGPGPVETPEFVSPISPKIEHSMSGSSNAGRSRDVERFFGDY